RRGRPCLVDDAAAGGEPVALPAGPRPARVALRHRQWARLAIEARAYTRQRGGTAYQPYLHPDLADLPSDQGHERFDLLLGALPVRSGTLVDLGANSGYFSHRFEAAGFDCVAVERSQKEAHFLTALRDAAGRRFAVLRGSLTEVALPERPDVVLALNVFHHFLKTEAGFRELAGFLDRLHARFLLFEAHLPDDPQMAQAPHNMPPGEFVEWVRRAGGFASVHEIGHAADGRPLYLLAAEG
ncbi:MAG TPA: methyltransferase domain-containing protein, partial [Thermoanaerobaculia bacterium]|nr:methyltransferase domain-containing protein [Thermoanaerobaculia bacterium]